MSEAIVNSSAVAVTTQPKSVRNYYFGLRARILLRLLLTGKLTPLKVWNATACYASYFLKRRTSAKSPLLINFELWNECNEVLPVLSFERRSHLRHEPRRRW